jgi:hypothetical protein
MIEKLRRTPALEARQRLIDQTIKQSLCAFQAQGCRLLPIGNAQRPAPAAATPPSAVHLDGAKA